MEITRDDVLHLADLVKIGIAPDEADALRSDLAAVLDYVRILDEVDTAGVEPLDTFGAGEFREDVPGPTLNRADLEMLEHYDADTGCFTVPAIFGDTGGHA